MDMTFILNELNKQPKHARNSRLWASDIVCPRKASFEAQITIQDNGKFKDYFTEIGKTFEIVTLQRIRDNGKLIAFDCRLPSNTFNLGGKIDALVFDDVHNRVEIVEIKSAKSTEQKIKHLYQTYVYGLFLNLNCNLIYFERNISEYRWQTGEHQLLYKNHELGKADNYANIILSNIYKADLAIKAGRIATKPKITKTLCNTLYCPLFDNCYGEAFAPLEDYELTEYDNEQLNIFIEEFTSTEAIRLRRKEFVNEVIKSYKLKDKKIDKPNKKYLEWIYYE